MKEHAFPPLPWHLFATLAFLIMGIFAGREMGYNTETIATVCKPILHPLILAAVTVALTVIAIGTLLLTNRLRWLPTTLILIAMTASGATIIRLHDVYNYHEYQWQKTVSPIGFMEQGRKRLADIYVAEGLKGDERAVVTAMTLGEKQQISKELRTAYSKSGAAHVFALSGLHLGIIFAILTFVMPRRQYPWLCAAVICAFIWTYTLLVGCRTSIVRATVMMTIYMVIPLMGRRTTGVATVLSTAILLLFIKPAWFFDIGFLMSFAAVICIVTFYQYLYVPEVFGLMPDRLPKTVLSYDRKHRMIAKTKLHTVNSIKALARWIYGLTVVSVTAQVAVAPIIAWNFGIFSPWFLLSNYIVSPCAMVIIPLALLTLGMGSVITYLPFLQWPLTLCTGILQGVIRFMNETILWIATLPGN